MCENTLNKEHFCVCFTFRVKTVTVWISLNASLKIASQNQILFAAHLQNTPLKCLLLLSFLWLQFREKIQDILPQLPAQHDHFLLRWLRGEVINNEAPAALRWPQRALAEKCNTPPIISLLYLPIIHLHVLTKKICWSRYCAKSRSCSGLLHERSWSNRRKNTSVWERDSRGFHA